MIHKISIVLITLNAESFLEKCLESCTWAAQIVVIDSGSNDKTLEIAKKYNSKIIQKKWVGFGLQKQFAVSQADFDWVLCLDADEWLSDLLIKQIKQILIKPQYNAYYLIRCNYFMGKFLRYGEGYPDKVLRLFNRRYTTWSNHQVHEYVNPIDNVGILSADLMHNSGEDLYIYLQKQNKYTSLQANFLYTQNKNVNIFKLIFSPILRFFKFYFLRKGFLDGLPGFVHITIGCWNSFIKYVKLKELWRKGL